MMPRDRGLRTTSDHTPTAYDRLAEAIAEKDAELAALRAQLAEAQADRDKARAALDAERRELAAAHDLAEYQAKKLHDALGDFADVPGGFVETVCHHIRAMRQGIAQLVVGRVITMSRGAEIMGLSVRQMRMWASSGIMQRDADAARSRRSGQTKGGDA